jgi:tetratricopeptide (TPR) repeat protein
MLDNLRDWYHRRRVMGELHGLNRVNEQAAYWHVKNRLEEMKKAFERDDLRMVRAVWADLIPRYRKQVAASPAALQLQLEMNWLDEAEGLLREHRKRRPSDPLGTVGMARVAQRRGDFEKAVVQWADVRKRFPVMHEGYSQGAANLARAARFDEAEAVLSRGLERLPNNFDCLMEHARLAEARKDWALALSRWQTLVNASAAESSLGYQMGTTGMAMSLRRLRRFEEAEMLLVKLRTLMPINPLPALEYAGIAEDRGDLSEAVQRWRQVHQRFPQWQPSYSGLIAALRKVGEAEQVETVLADAAGRFVEDAHWSIDYAESAESRGDFNEAASRWQTVRQRFPQREEGYRRGADAIAKLGHVEAAAAVWSEYKQRLEVSPE